MQEAWCHASRQFICNTQPFIHQPLANYHNAPKQHCYRVLAPVPHLNAVALLAFSEYTCCLLSASATITPPLPPLCPSPVDHQPELVPSQPCNSSQQHVQHHQQAPQQVRGLTRITTIERNRLSILPVVDMRESEREREKGPQICLKFSSLVASSGCVIYSFAYCLLAPSAYLLTYKCTHTPSLPHSLTCPDLT